ncbi:hypothetical protein GE061_005372, partial [Apolygus lucorum]
GDEFLTKELLSTVLSTKELFLNGATLHGKYFLRYAICSRNMELSDVEKGWNIISNATDAVFSMNTKTTGGTITSLAANAVTNGMKIEMTR